MPVRRVRHSPWSNIQEVHPEWVEQAGSITQLKQLIVYEAHNEGFQIRFLKAPENHIRFQVRERLY
jgi:hypothetical protein